MFTCKAEGCKEKTNHVYATKEFSMICCDKCEARHMKTGSFEKKKKTKKKSKK